MLIDTGSHDALIEAFLRDVVGDPVIDRRIAAADPLLGYLDRIHHGLRGRALVDYFRGGWSAHRLVRQALRLRFGDRAAGATVLDFGSGFGRTTRFLLREHPRERIVVADVMADAVEHQRLTWGVRGFVSPSDPRELAAGARDVGGGNAAKGATGTAGGRVEGGEAGARGDGDASGEGERGGERFDLVIAVSVLTHLPPDEFPSWLAALRALVAPGGLLLFTVNDASTLLPGRALDASGACFEPASENERLDPRRYGSTWVRETFVARALGGTAYRRIPRGVWAAQDVYVVPAGGAPLEDPLPVSLEPAGRLEAAVLLNDGAVALSGWAAMPDGSPVAAIAAVLDGRPITHGAPAGERADVATQLGARGGAHAWRLLLEASPAPLPMHGLLRVEAVSAEGVPFALHLDTLAETLVYARTAALHERIERLEHEVRLRDLELGRQKTRMGALWWGARNRHFELKALKRELELSRFWKLRNRWWAAKRRLRLGR